MSRTAPLDPSYDLELQEFPTLELESAATYIHRREINVSRGLLKGFEPYTALNDSNRSADNPSWRRSKYLRILRIITMIPSLCSTVDYMPRYANFPHTVYHDGNGVAARLMIYAVVTIPWDVSRILHSFYDRSPGLNFLFVFLVDVCIVAGCVADMAQGYSVAAKLPALIVSSFVPLLHIQQCTYWWRDYRLHSNTKPRLVFTAAGKPVAIYVSSDLTENLEMDRLSIDSLQEDRY